MTKAQDQRPIELKKRLEQLESFKATELQLDKPSQTYISDLNDSIAGYKRELKFLDKNPGGFEFVNGYTGG